MAVSVSNTVHYKRVVAVGNDELWYEDLDVAAGTMVKLAASDGEIDTSDNLNMFELLQKVFIVNGSKLRVADFINTKITTADIKPADKVVPLHGDIIVGGTSEAAMVVDYIDASDGACNIYGYRTTVATFISGDVVTGSNDNGDISFTLNANETAPPHWYNWTVYANDTDTYGTLPNKAYLGCNYRGRAVLAGDPEHPHQWYMSRQLNPWDWTYVANDAQSPVAGGNSDAGEIGDIIRALIPYKDDYLITGCASTIWFIAGDPAEGGSINELDLTIGIFGANSWCFDGLGYLYLFGTNGLYKTTIPGQPECVSNVKLPNLVNDEAVDPSQHRITMAYDRVRNGILVCITKLSDGTNSNYWYDLITGGFFPETYPDECGAYSLCYYASNDPDYRDLLVGCKDGYIRKFDESAEDDDIGVSDEAIDSYIGFGPLQINKDPISKGKISDLILITAGGDVNGSESDSDDVTCKVWVDKTAETIKEKMDAEAAPNISKVFKAPGRQRGYISKHKLTGVYAGIELRNNTAAQTWGFEQLLIDAKPVGKEK